jgi:hypothetical protein
MMACTGASCHQGHFHIPRSQQGSLQPLSCPGVAVPSALRRKPQTLSIGRVCPLESTPSCLCVCPTMATGGLLCSRRTPTTQGESHPHLHLQALRRLACGRAHLTRGTLPAGKQNFQ